MSQPITELKEDKKETENMISSVDNNSNNVNGNNNTNEDNKTKQQNSNLVINICIWIAIIIYPFAAIAMLINTSKGFNRIIHCIGLFAWSHAVILPRWSKKYKADDPSLLIHYSFLLAMYSYIIIFEDLHVSGIWSVFKNAFLLIINYFSEIASNTSPVKIIGNCVKLYMLAIGCIMYRYYLKKLIRRLRSKRRNDKEFVKRVSKGDISKEEIRETEECKKDL